VSISSQRSGLQRGVAVAAALDCTTWDHFHAVDCCRGHFPARASCHIVFQHCQQHCRQAVETVFLYPIQPSTAASLTSTLAQAQGICKHMQRNRSSDGVTKGPSCRSPLPPHLNSSASGPQKDVILLTTYALYTTWLPLGMMEPSGRVSCCEAKRTSCTSSSRQQPVDVMYSYSIVNATIAWFRFDCNTLCAPTWAGKCMWATLAQVSNLT
jgi:hypothetical protein